MNEMGGAGFVTGVVLGAVASIAFLVTCLYSAYKAIKDRRRILIKNETIRAQRLEEVGGEMGEAPLEHNHTAAANHVNGTAGAASSTSLATPGGNEERRPSAAFKPPPAPPEKQWDQKGVHYRSEGGIMHIHKSDSKLSTGPGDETEKQPLMSAPDDAGESSDDKAQETETVPSQQVVAGTTSSSPVATETATSTTAASSTTNETIDGSETTAQVHVTVSVTEHQDQVITSTSTEGLKSVDASDPTGSVAESNSTTTTTKQKLFTSTNIDGTRTQTGTELPEVANGNSTGGDPAAWV